MTRDEFCDVGRTLFGRWGWQTRLAEALDVDGSTVRRWVSGTTPVPGPVVAAVACWLERRRIDPNFTPLPAAREAATDSVTPQQKPLGP